MSRSSDKQARASAETPSPEEADGEGRPPAGGQTAAVLARFAGLTEVEHKSVVSSVAKALSILECFSPDAAELSLAELADATGLNKTTCHRLVSTLELVGWLRRTDRGAYRPGVVCFRVGTAAVSKVSLLDEARPVLLRLAQRFGDTVFLTVADDTRAVFLDRVEGDHPVRVAVGQVGTSVPLHVGAGSRTILSHRPDLLRRLCERELPAIGPRTITDPEALADELERIRVTGYAVSDEDILAGVAAVGAPIWDSSGKVVAAVSVGGIRERLQPPRLEGVILGVLDAAREITEKLGGPPPPAPRLG